MVSLKLVAVIVCFLQLHAHGLCDSKDDAQNAISLLFDELESARNLVLTASDIWSVDVSDISQTINDQLVDDIEQFKILLSNVTAFAENYTDGEYCVRGLDRFLNASNYRVDVIGIENVVFQNLFNWAYVDIQSGINKYYELYQELTQNCLDSESNCEGLNDGIIAEVDRILPVIKRIPYQLLAEKYLLNFRTLLNWSRARVHLMEDYHKAIDNATVCLASVIKNYTQTRFVELPQTENVGDSIQDLYQQLVEAVDSASSSSYSGMSRYVNWAMIDDHYGNIATILHNVSFETNSTVYSIKHIARDLNLSVACTTPDVQSALDSSFAKSLDDHHAIWDDLLNSQYARGSIKVGVIKKEVESIGIQVEACEAEGTCDYLSKKIMSKIRQIPLVLQKLGDSTSVLLLRSVPMVWEIGNKGVRDLLEQFEIEIVTLKSCVQSYL